MITFSTPVWQSWHVLYVVMGNKIEDSICFPSSQSTRVNSVGSTVSSVVVSLMIMVSSMSSWATHVPHDHKHTISINCLKRCCQLDHTISINCLKRCCQLDRHAVTEKNLKDDCPSSSPRLQHDPSCLKRCCQLDHHAETMEILKDSPSISPGLQHDPSCLKRCRQLDHHGVLHNHGESSPWLCTHTISINCQLAGFTLPNTFIQPSFLDHHCCWAWPLLFHCWAWPYRICSS